MASPIRPFTPPFTPPPPQAARSGAPGEAARAAQRAFFSQAMNGVQAQAPLAEAAPTAPMRRQAAPERISLPAEAPDRPVRPGTYLDIKV